MKYVGALFVILGFISLVYGGVAYRPSEAVLRVGDFDASPAQTRHAPIPPAFGIVLLLGGVAMVFADDGGVHRR